MQQPRIVSDYPHRVREVEQELARLADGTRLAARCWFADAAAFGVRARLEAFEADESVLTRGWNESIPRDGV